MPNESTIFLTIDQVLDAISNDFSQYPSQLTLFSTLWPLVFGKDAYLMRDPEHQTVWIKTPDLKQLRQVPINRVGDWIVRRLKQSAFPAEQLARMCTLVFQAPAVADNRKKNSTIGIWIETGMDGFTCLQCGRCCRMLTYRDGCTPADVAHWQALGRADILKWVGTIERDGRVVACRIWMVPETNEYAETCPWLKKTVNRRHYLCAIHDVRPSICRQYPGSRKHARMTGCRGI